MFLWEKNGWWVGESVTYIGHGLATQLSHPWHTENLIYLLLFLLVLNVEIVVPTADQYAMRLGASESFWVGRSLKGLGLDVSMVGIGSPRLFI